MIENAIKTNDYQFEPVHVNWSGLRTQMIIGLLSIFCLCLGNFFPFWHASTYTLIYSHFIDFTLYFVSCSLVAWITLEIGGIFGNRNGAGYAIWSAIIFAVFPTQAILCLPAFRGERTISFFILLFVLILLRRSNYWRQLSRKAVSIILLCLTIPLLFPAWFPYIGLIILSAAALAIALGLICFPTIGTVSMSHRQLYGQKIIVYGLGLIVIVGTTSAYERQFIVYQTDLIKASPALHP